jgi:DNA-binding transcriptional regulator YdaS (Cro superfamily)
MEAAAVATAALLDEVEDTFALSETELAELFGVRRQAIGQWRARGLPAARQEKASAIASVATLLRHRLRPERIPGIARRPAKAYGGHTMLEMIRRDRHLELLMEVRRSFDWAAAA